MYPSLILPRVAVRKHPALVACVPVKCLNSFLVTPQIETKLVSVDRSSPALSAIAQGILLCSAKAEQWPKQRQSKPSTDLLPKQKTFSLFQFPFAGVRGMPSESRSIPGKRRIDCSACKRSSKKLERTAISAFFLDRARRASGRLTVRCCDRSWPPRKCKGIVCFASSFRRVRVQLPIAIVIYRKCLLKLAVSSKQNYALLYARGRFTPLQLTTDVSMRPNFAPDPRQSMRSAFHLNVASQAFTWKISICSAKSNHVLRCLLSGELATGRARLRTGDRVAASQLQQLT